MWADAWRTLRRNPLFIISGLLILFIIVVAIAPGLFTKQDPNACDLGNSLSPASAGHPFGYDLQGCDDVHPAWSTAPVPHCLSACSPRCWS